MAERPFEGGDGRNIFSERGADAEGLGSIGRSRSVAMGHDHADIAGFDACVLQCSQDGSFYAVAIATNVEDAGGFANAAGTKKLAEYGGLPRLSLLRGLKDHGPST